MLTIGCHLSDKDGYLGMAKAAVSIGANTFQFFTRNPRGGAQKALDPQDIAAFEDYAPEHGIEVILGYAPYTANPASADQREHDFTMMVLAEDLARMAETPQAMYTLQPAFWARKPCFTAASRWTKHWQGLPRRSTTRSRPRRRRPCSCRPWRARARR